MTFSLCVRESMMIAHSFSGEEFGPAQNMHGATYTVDCEFMSDELVPKSNWVIDIGLAGETLKQVLSKYNYKNLDDIPEFANQNTTTEFMCRQVFLDMRTALSGKFAGKMKVQLAESHSAWASYTGSV